MDSSQGWRTSNYSGNFDCVEVAELDDDDMIGVRDSKSRNAGHLELERQAFTSLVRRIERGELDTQ